VAAYLKIRYDARSVARLERASGATTRGIDPRKAAGYGIVGALFFVLVVQYLMALGPSTADDRLAACRTLGPMSFNPALGKFPTKAPDFEAQDYTGQATPLSAYRGKVVFLNFWQTACEACKVEIPSMERLQKEVGADKFTILALASEKDWSRIWSFFGDAGSSMTVLLDPPDATHNVGQISLHYGTEQWPETYLIDKTGKIRFYYINSRTWDSGNGLECVRALINE
jgi:peroxiredoxin